MQAEILSQGFNFIDFCYVENVQCDSATFWKKNSHINNAKF